MPVQQFGDLLADAKKLNRHLIKVIASCFILAMLAMYFFDQKVSAFFAVQEVRDSIRGPARILTDFALSEYWLTLALLVWAFAKWGAPRAKIFDGYPDKIDFFRRWGLNFFVAQIIAGLITHLIKFSVGRQRPHKTPDFDPYVFAPLNTHWHWQSFSSGHSQVIFTVATMMSIAFPKFRWFWIPFAILICLTRVIVHDHFLSDIIFGACVGYVGTLLSLFVMRVKTKNGLY